MSNNQNNNEWQGESSNNNNGGGPCGACKYRRRKCDEGCVFAPYFDSEHGTAHFEAVHKVFGASNVSRLLHRIPVHRRLDAVVSLCYEALSRVRDPVFGCVADITTLQQQVINMQAELAIVKAKLATLHSFTGANYTPNSWWVDEISSTNSNTLNNMPMAMFKNEFGLYPPSPLVSAGAGAGAGAEAGAGGSSITPSQLSNFSNLTHNYQQDDMLVFEDGDLQTLTREYVSKFRNY